MSGGGLRYFTLGSEVGSAEGNDTGEGGAPSSEPFWHCLYMRCGPEQCRTFGMVLRWRRRCCCSVAARCSGVDTLAARPCTRLDLP